MGGSDASDSLGEIVRNDKMTRLNVVSLLAQGGYAMKKGNTERGLLLIGTALVAARYKRFSYAIQGALTVNDLRKKIT